MHEDAIETGQGTGQYSADKTDPGRCIIDAPPSIVLCKTWSCSIDPFSQSRQTDRRTDSAAPPHTGVGCALDAC